MWLIDQSVNSRRVLDYVNYSVHIALSQERLKKLKSEHGKVQLGNITIDMVYLFLAFIILTGHVTKLIVQILIGMLIYTLWKGSWWNERNDRIIVGNLIAWSRRGRHPFYHLKILRYSCVPQFMPHLELQYLFNWNNSCSLMCIVVLFWLREFASGVCLYLNVRSCYLQQSLEENRCLKVFSGFFWQER